MPKVEMSLRIDWRKFYLTRTKIWIAFAVWAGIAVVTSLTIYVLAFTGRSDIVIGGDFIAFYAAAKATAMGAASEIYESAYFQNLLTALYPAKKEITLTWQYPPTYLLLVFPLAIFSHLIGFAIWSTGTAAGYFMTMRKIVNDRLVLFAIIACPSAYAAYITGQNGFLSAILITLAVVYPKSRPMLAGVAAGILTVKPHLGLLIPVAFVAAGCWRAFFFAAMTSLLLVAISIAAFGLETWQAFFNSVQHASEMLDDRIMPLRKMATPYSAALFLALPAVAAKVIYLLFAALSALIVWRVWTRIDDRMWRASALIACVFMAAPYGFHYELIMLALPLAMIAERAVKSGWLPLERWMLGAAVVLPLTFGSYGEARYGVSVGFIAVTLAFFMTMRRIHLEAPGIFFFGEKKAAA